MAVVSRGSDGLSLEPPAGFASGVEGLEKAMMVKVTMPSPRRSMANASSPDSGCPGSVP